MPILAFKAIGDIICQNWHDSVVFHRFLLIPMQYGIIC